MYGKMWIINLVWNQKKSHLGCSFWGKHKIKWKIHFPYSWDASELGSHITNWLQWGMDRMSICPSKCTFICLGAVDKNLLHNSVSLKGFPLYVLFSILDVCMIGITLFQTTCFFHYLSLLYFASGFSPMKNNYKVLRANMQETLFSKVSI